MNNLSMIQALDLWSELEAAFYRKNGFGGDTAEIYMYRLMGYAPAVAHNPPDIVERAGIVGDSAREAYDTANRSLHNLLVHFADKHEVRIEVDGKELGPWLKTARLVHRVHVKVVRRTEAVRGWNDL